MNSLTPAALGVSIAVNLSAAAMNAATSMHAALHVAASLLTGATSMGNVVVITIAEQMDVVVITVQMGRVVTAGASGHRAGAHYDGWSAGSSRGCSAGGCSLTLRGPAMICRCVLIGAWQGG